MSMAKLQFIQKQQLQWWHGRYYWWHFWQLIKTVWVFDRWFCVSREMWSIICDCVVSGFYWWPWRVTIDQGRPGRTAVRIPQLPALSRLRELREPRQFLSKVLTGITWSWASDRGNIKWVSVIQEDLLLSIYHFIPCCPIQFYSIKLVTASILWMNKLICTVLNYNLVKVVCWCNYLFSIWTLGDISDIELFSW